MITDWYPAAREELVAGGWTERGIGIFTRLLPIESRSAERYLDCIVITRALCERFGLPYSEKNSAKFAILMSDLGEAWTGVKGMVEKL